MSCERPSSNQTAIKLQCVIFESRTVNCNQTAIKLQCTKFTFEFTFKFTFKFTFSKNYIIYFTLDFQQIFCPTKFSWKADSGQEDPNHQEPLPVMRPQSKASARSRAMQAAPPHEIPVEALDVLRNWRRVYERLPSP